MELQDALADSQLLIAEVTPSDHSCHFLFVGPRKPNTFFILKEGILFHDFKKSHHLFWKVLWFSQLLLKVQ